MMNFDAYIAPVDCFKSCVLCQRKRNRLHSRFRIPMQDEIALFVSVWL